MAKDDSSGSNASDNERKFAKIDAQFAEIGDRFNTVEVRFNTMEVKFERRFDAIETSIRSMERSIALLTLNTPSAAQQNLSNATEGNQTLNPPPPPIHNPSRNKDPYLLEDPVDHHQHRTTTTLPGEDRPRHFDHRQPRYQPQNPPEPLNPRLASGPRIRPDQTPNPRSSIRGREAIDKADDGWDGDAGDYRRHPHLRRPTPELVYARGNRRLFGQNDFDESSDDEDMMNIVNNTPERHPSYRDHTPERYPPRQDRPDFKLKMDLPTFDGRLHIEDFLDWLSNVENFFDYLEIPENRKVKYVAYKMKGGASA